MDTLFLHDTIAKVDTLFIQAPATQKAWFETWAPWIGLFLTLAGWFISSFLTRRNALKSFEEGVLDKIRIEMNTPLMTYHTFLNELLFAVDMLRRASPEDSHKSHDGQHLAPTAEGIAKPLEISDSGLWLSLFEQYSLCFENFSETFTVLRRRHTEIIRKTNKLINEYTQFKPEAKAYHIDTLFKLVNEQYALRDQFSIFLQYECLKNMKRIKRPDFTKPKSGERIVRTKKGKYLVVDPDLETGKLSH